MAYLDKILLIYIRTNEKKSTFIFHEKIKYNLNILQEKKRKKEKKRYIWISLSQLIETCV